MKKILSKIYEFVFGKDDFEPIEIYDTPENRETIRRAISEGLISPSDL